MESKTIEFFNKLSFNTILATLFISFFFFIPFLPVSLDVNKTFIISIGVLISAFFWLITRLGEGKFIIPKDKLIVFSGLIPIVFFISSFFSSSKYLSFFGSGFETGTFGAVFILFTLFFLSSVYFQTEKRIWYFYIILFLGFLILSLFQIFDMFFGFNRFLPGFLSGITSGNIIGSLNDFALLYGLIVLIATFSINFLKSSKLLRLIQFSVLLIGLFFLIIINVPLVWFFVGSFSVFIFMYSLSVQQIKFNTHQFNERKKKFPFIALTLFLICFIFLFAGELIATFISKYISISNLDIRPSITATTKIIWQSIKHNAFLGTGPNTFSLDWNLWKPKEITQTLFWNTSFINGFSSLTTFIATTGIFGFLTWSIFLVTFFTKSIKSFKIALQDESSNYFIIVTLITSVYGWMSFIFYNPNMIMLMITFCSSGILISLLIINKIIKVKTISFLNDPRHSFFAIFLLIFLMISIVSIAYTYIEKFASNVYFVKSTSSVIDNSITSLSKSDKMISNAIVLDKNDVYYRTLSQIYIQEIQALINDKSISQDTLKLNVQQLITSSETSAKSAINQNPNEYLNYMNLGDIYSMFLSLSIDKSYENAINAYNQAKSLNPNNPSVTLARASLEFINKNNDGARRFINQALDLKTDYTDALLLLAKISISEGSIPEAIKQFEKIAKINPNDSTIFFKLGFLRYNNSDYVGAISAFERSVILDGNNLNARYFLGQAYQKVGRTNDALIQFNLLKKVFPNNQELINSISGLSTENSVNVLPTKSESKNTKPLLEKN